MSNSTRRLFFALWPSAEVSREMARLGQGAQGLCGGRAMRRQTLHLTLAFLGNVSSEMAEKALALAGALRCDPFDFRLDRLACWRHNHIVWIGCSVVPAALAGLAADLARTLAGAEFQLEKRSFAAHITLLRNARCPESLSEPEPILWQARDFVLVESKLSAQGANYEIVGRWPLG